MKRVHVICEGQTEMVFCLKLLAPYLVNKGITLTASPIGGIKGWEKLKKQIETHLNGTNVFVTTFIDYYGIQEKHHFPGWTEKETQKDVCERVDFVEQQMEASIDDRWQYRFLPYLQLHEFEALLFTDKAAFDLFNDRPIKMDELEGIFAEFDNPELINSSKETSPSHRLGNIICGYDKVIDGNLLAETIGLDQIRSKVPRFNRWIEKIESRSFAIQ